MPYTPPAQRSPAGTANPSPSISRRSSFQPAPSGPPTSHRPQLPRSTSYLQRQRRAQAVIKTAPLAEANEPSPPGTADRESDDNGPIKRPPSPVTGDAKIPPGAVISPPDSSQNSSDDEGLEMGHGSRGRTLENLAELQAAIRIIEQRKESSPTRTADDVSKANRALSLIMPNGDKEVEAAVEQTLSNNRLGLRKIVHNRSKTDTSVPLFVGMRQSPSTIETPLGGSEDESDGDDPESFRRKPKMVRKKSGELVRPALRPASARRRPSSMPGTPTFGKAVHFDSQLEHVRHFLQVDRPLAVSAGSSPVEPHDSDSEFPFDEASPTGRSAPFEWEIVISNFPGESPIRLSQPVRVERVFLSADNKTLVGSCAIANLAFNKWVVARFTLDYWKTTSEVVAEYNHDVRQPKLPDGRDRFNFNIKLADLANLEAKTMFFCVKSCVNGQEHWDNNNGHNFQVDFRKKPKPQNGKRGMQGAGSRPANSLPRSNKKSPLNKPRSAAFDDFGNGFDEKYSLDFAQPVHDYLGEDNNPIRLKGVKSAVTLSSNSPLRKNPNPGQAFGNRYDFGASLSAAINAAQNVMGDKSGITFKPGNNKPRANVAQDADECTSPRTITKPQPKPALKAANVPASGGTESPRPAGSEKPALASQSYNELLDKYCFFGSVKSSPQLKDGSLRSGQFDGANDTGYIMGSTDSSSEASPVMAERRGPPGLSHLSRSASPAPMTGLAAGTAIRG